MRANKHGPEPDMKRKHAISALRKKGYSFSEIEKMLGFHSRQAVQYHYYYLQKVGKTNLTKSYAKSKMTLSSKGANKGRKTK